VCIWFAPDSVRDHGWDDIKTEIRWVRLCSELGKTGVQHCLPQQGIFALYSSLDSVLKVCMFIDFISKWPLLLIQCVTICIKADIPCETTFFPQTTTCATWFEPSVFTQATVFSAFDTLEDVSSTVSSARGSLHYFRGVYSTGVLSDWPSLWRGEFVSCRFLSCRDADTPPVTRYVETTFVAHGYFSYVFRPEVKPWLQT